MSDVKNIDFNTFPDELLPTRFLSDDSHTRFLKVFLEEEQLFQDELRKFIEQGMDVDKATGRQLDIVAKLSNIIRDTDEADEDLRSRVKLRRFIDNSSGTINELLRFLNEITGNTESKLFEYYPASIMAQTTSEDYPADLANSFDKLCASGVNGHTVLHLRGGNGLIFEDSAATHTLVATGSGEVGMGAGEDTALSAGYVLPDDPSTVKESSKLVDSTLLYRSSLRNSGEDRMHSGENEADSGGLILNDPPILKGVLGNTYTNDKYL